ncbi:MAG: Mur ligase family protein [Steroidobacterales bacterium]
MPELPFDDSRRLQGANLFFASTGAVLEAIGVATDDALTGAWRDRVQRAGAHLGWGRIQAVARRHAGGASLAIAAPVDQLFLATEVNEWALCTAVLERDPRRWSKLREAWVAEALRAAEGTPNPAAGSAPVIEEAAAFERFARLSALEARPRLRALLDAAALRRVPHVLDEELLTLGAGCGGRDFPLQALPDAATLNWTGINDIPTALVTGSNGKTTTVRLLATCARAEGLRAAYNCTDGVFSGDEMLAAGDYSGPAGARRVLREPRAQAAILETARGGILRRGIAVSQAHVALITNISSDHFGEYGIDDLEGLADVKLTVGAVVSPQGLLVLNAEDPLLRARSGALAARFGRAVPLGWFAASSDPHALSEYRDHGAPTCGVHTGRLLLTHRGAEHDLGSVAAMPLSMQGVATYNIANLAGAALAAAALGVRPATIAAVFAGFGARLEDNPGRMMRFDREGITVLVDYAHNPDGLHGFLRVASHLRGGKGRLGLLLGHAGNRKDADVEELARVAFGFHPDLIVVKENEKHLRGRAPGEIPHIIQAELRRQGFPEAAMPLAGGGEVGAARYALDWARPGDVLALPVHSAQARATVVAMLRKP